MAISLPTDLTYGKVMGLFLRGVADSTDDPDRMPDGQPALGIITFTSVVPIVKTASPLATVGFDVVKCSVDSNGFLVDPTGQQGVWLFTGQWDVKYQMVGLNIPAHRIEVLVGHTDVAPLWLNNAMPPSGPPLEPSQYTLLDARLQVVEGAGTPPDASTTVKGLVELATTAETTTGTDTARAVTPAGVKAVADGKSNTGHTHTASAISDFNAAVAAAAPPSPAVTFAPAATWRAPWPQLNGSTGTRVINQLMLWPILIPHALTLTGLGAAVRTAGAASTTELCIYSDNGSFFPDALIKATSALASTAVGTIGESFAGVALAAGLYWIGDLSHGTTAPSMEAAVTQSNSGSPFMWGTMPHGSGATPTVNSGNDGQVAVYSGRAVPPATFAGSLATNKNSPQVAAWMALKVNR